MSDEQYWIETQAGQRIDGPYSTRDDALRARMWVEKVKAPASYWVRSSSESHTNRVSLGVPE